MIIRSPQSMRLSVSDSGTPRRRASTRIGSSFAISSMKSNSPIGRARSRITRVSSRSAVSYAFTARGVNGGPTSPRRRVCRGGSVSSIERRATIISSSRSSRFAPCAEEYVFVSRETATTSSCFVTHQKPSPPGQSYHQTGASRRRSANVSCGTRSTNASFSRLIPSSVGSLGHPWKYPLRGREDET